MIKQAFQSLPIPEVQVNVELGHYDLVTRKDVTILPQAWETSVQPGMTISMHLWSMPVSEAPPVTDFFDSGPPPRDSSMERRLRRMNMQPPNPLAPASYGIRVPTRSQAPPQSSYASAAGPTGRADSGYHSIANQSLFNQNQGNNQPAWTRYASFPGGRTADREPWRTSSSSDSGADASSLDLSYDYSKPRRGVRASKKSKKGKQARKVGDNNSRRAEFI